MSNEDKVLEFILKNVRIVGWEVLGCSECPFSSEHSDINSSDPDEGYYNCELLGKQKIWGENPECSDTDWVNYIRTKFSFIRKEE